MEKVKEYNRYLKKCEMLGIKDFEFGSDGEDIVITKYIENDEPERLIRIPDFVDRVDEDVFFEVKQSLIVNADRLRNIRFDCYSGEKLDLRGINTTMIESMELMFANCDRLKEININGFNTSNVVNMAEMFYEDHSLEKINLSSLDTSSVISMNYMFDGCENIKELDLCNFNTGKVMTVHRMFGGCSRLEKLDLRCFDVKSIVIKTEMFNGCDNLKLIMTNKKCAEWINENRDYLGLNERCEIEVRE